LFAAPAAPLPRAISYFFRLSRMVFRPDSLFGLSVLNLALIPRNDYAISVMKMHAQLRGKISPQGRPSVTLAAL
jgi:hypothetical protein